jgi:hypothetical protein
MSEREARKVKLGEKLKQLYAEEDAYKEHGDAGELATVEDEIQNVQLEMDDVPKTKWAEIKANARAKDKAEVRRIMGDQYIPEHTISDRPISELAGEAAADVEQRENEEILLDPREMFADAADADERGESITGVGSTEYASLKRADREARVAVLKKAVEKMFKETSTKKVA